MKTFFVNTMSVLLLFSLANANWPESACAAEPSQSDYCNLICTYKHCGYDHWCSCASCLPMSYCMTACTFITCATGKCCTCGYCYVKSGVPAVAQASETNITALMSSGSYSWDCGDDCDITNSFCYKSHCYAIEECEGACEDVVDCDTCFCGFCLDDESDTGTDEEVANTLGSGAQSSPEKPDVVLSCVVLSVIVFIGVVGLCYVRILNQSSYAKFASALDKRPTSVGPSETELNHQKPERKRTANKSVIYF